MMFIFNTNNQIVKAKKNAILMNKFQLEEIIEKRYMFVYQFC